VEAELLAAAHPITGMRFVHFRLGIRFSAVAKENRPCLVPTSTEGIDLLWHLHGRKEYIQIDELRELIPPQKVEWLDDGNRPGEYVYRLYYRGEEHHYEWLSSAAKVANALHWLINPPELMQP
jgi:hypothetical protein